MRVVLHEHSNLSSFLRHLRGVFVFAGFTINTIFWFVPIFLLAIVKLLVPIAPFRRWLTRVLMAMAEIWISINSAPKY